MALGLTPPLVCVLFNNHPIIIFIVIFIFTNNHLRCVSCSTITPSLSLSTQCFHNAPNYIDLDLLDYQLINLQKYTPPPSPPQTPALPKTVANLSRRSISPGSDLSSPPATRDMHCRVPIFVKFFASL